MKTLNSKQQQDKESVVQDILSDHTFIVEDASNI
jgi:hypothetical protein